MRAVKYIPFFLFLLSAFCLQAQQSSEKINWLTFDEAIKKNKKEARNIMIDFYTHWCGPCKMMDAYTFKDTTIASYVNKHFYAVKFNAEGNEVVTYKKKKYENTGYDKSRSPRSRNATHPLTLQFELLGYPTAVFLDSNLDLIKSYAGFLRADRFMAILKEQTAAGTK